MGVEQSFQKQNKNIFNTQPGVSPYRFYFAEKEKQNYPGTNQGKYLR